MHGQADRDVRDRRYSLARASRAFDAVASPGSEKFHCERAKSLIA